MPGGAEGCKFTRHIGSTRSDAERPSVRVIPRTSAYLFLAVLLAGPRFALAQGVFHLANADTAISISADEHAARLTRLGLPPTRGFSAADGRSRSLSINHLQRLPSPFPGSPRHNPGTPNLSWSRLRHKASALAQRCEPSWLLVHRPAGSIPTRMPSTHLRGSEDRT